MELKTPTEKTTLDHSAQATVVAERKPSRGSSVGSGSSMFQLARILDLSDALAQVAEPPDAPAARNDGARSRQPGLTERSRRLKRAMDIVGASILLILTAPILLIAVVLVRLTSLGPIVFKQTRTGLNLRELSVGSRRDARGSIPCGAERRSASVNDRRALRFYGKPFVIYKIRTMCVEAEKNGPRLATAGDPRVTGVGRFLRRSRIDELPQLWNVLRGDMSLIGPRPERPELIKQLTKVIPTYLGRLESKPGLTGLAQVKNGYDTSLDSFRRKVELDIHYLRNWSIWADVKILCSTVYVVISGKGAR